ncbi:KaiC [Candidatus Bilamarchaeum dharawalense]|uniref:KaiC n=1 Tax=Candidatus Bilamarchaeum dharawalense TaxID=2885759 RepID=A0A5E4LX48_9ARCH|nr:KaiC [Candidatus Bilamarchaeum dharawalense]
MIFAERLAKIKDGEVVLVTVSPESYIEISHAIMKEMIKNRGKKGVYITLNRPYQQIEKELLSINIDPKKTYFIDVANRKNDFSTRHCSIESPADLTEISIAITDALSSERYQFLYIDSVQTLSMYQNEAIAEQFLYYLSRKIRLYGITGFIVLSGGKKTKKIEDAIAQFCDNILHFSLE